MSIRITDGLRRERLPNGVTLLFQRRRTVPAAAQVTVMRAGFLDEPDDLVGVSHVLEHMLFKGTPTLAPGELAQRTKALGGSINAYTSYDRTVYYATMPARHALEAGELQADQVQRSLIDDGELSRELGVIIQEAKRKLDSPDALVGETLHRLLYREHRIRRWRIGIEEDLERLTGNDVREYYRSRYRPDRAVVALVADLDPDEALAALREQWGSWTAPTSPIPSGPSEVTFPSNETERFERDVTRADLVLGWRVPGIHHPDAPALELVAALLSQGRGATLNRQLRDPGIVGGIGASYYGVADVGVFAIGADAEDTRVGRVIGGVNAAVRALAAAAPAAVDLDRARTMMRARFQRSFERYEARAIALAVAEAEGDLERLERHEAEWLAVRPADITRVVAEYLTPEGAAGAVCLPRDSAVAFSGALLRQVDASSLALSAGAPEPPRMQPAAGARQVQAAVHGVHHLALEAVDLLTARFEGVDQCVLAWYGPPPGMESAATAGQGMLAVRSMLRGTTLRDTTGLALAFESLGGVLAPTISHDLVGFGVTVLAEHAARAAALLAEVQAAPGFDPALVAVEQRLQLDDARAIEDDMLRFPVQLMLGEAFGDTGYGAPMLGTPESLVSPDATTLRHWHREWRARGRTTLVAVGPGDPRRLADEIAGAIGAWPSDARERIGEAGRDEIPWRAGMRMVSRERQQSALAMLFPGPSRHDPQRYAAELWAAIAGGLGGRLFESLRSERSLAYTVIASSWQRRRAGGLLTYIATAPERLDEAREAMLGELARFVAEPPTAAEVTRARALLIGQEEIARQTAGAWAGAIAEAWLLGEGLGELEDPAAGYRLPDADAIHAVASAAFGAAARAEGVVLGTASG